MKLVSWAGNNNIMDNGLAEREDIGVGRQDREYKISIDGSSRFESRGDLWYKGGRWVREGDMLGKD